jgi:hypothetical protein
MPIIPIAMNLLGPPMPLNNIPVGAPSALFYQPAQYFVIDVVIASFLGWC